MRTRAFVEHIMGMPVSVHVRALDDQRADVAAAVSNLYAHLRRVDRIFSTWRDDSELLRLRRGELRIGDAHPWLADVVDLCIDAEERTDGLFSAWLPGPDGHRRFDPTGLVKGWGVAAAAAHLQDLPEIAFCVNAGGDIVAGTGRGMAQQQPTWRVGIEDPRDRGRIADVVTLTRGGLATSGTAARGAHLLDPRSGARLERAGSATVHGPDLLWADVWATAAFVDPDRAIALLAERDPAYALLTL